MITALLKVEFRKTWPYYAPILFIIIGYALLTGSVLKRANQFLAVAAGAQGWLLAWSLFRDPGHTAEFLFSRPISRLRLFLVRWTLGLGLQGVTLLSVAFVLAVGLRSALQVHMDSPYYPMVRWLELDILWPLALLSVAAYQLQSFFQIREQVMCASTSPWASRVIQGVATIMVVSVLHLALNWSDLLVPVSVSNASGQWLRMGFYGTVFYVVGSLLIGTLAASRYYRVMEV